MNERYGPYPYGPYNAPVPIWGVEEDSIEWDCWLWMSANFENHEWHWHSNIERVQIAPDLVLGCPNTKFWFQDEERAALYVLRWSGII